MPEMVIRLEDEDGAFRDVAFGKKVINVKNAIYLTALSGGMSSGKASVAMGFVVGGNKFILAETSLKLFLLGAAAVAAKFPDEAQEIPFYAQSQGVIPGGSLAMVTPPTADGLHDAIALLRGGVLNIIGPERAQKVKEVIDFLDSVRKIQQGK
ncbi:MAG: hypothetical protein WBV94_08865 [Blastocatellia bacterium]